jgi:aminodeoxyfutalosine deaminase
MINKFSADQIFLADQTLHNNKVIITDEDGKILAIDNLVDHDIKSINVLPGMIVPGFVNTHCHLELSHMKGIAPTGTGLLSFLNTVVNMRQVDAAIINQAIKDADIEMFDNGIVAVGDISNRADTAEVKSASRINYHTFVEMFDFMQDSLTESTIQQYSDVMAKQSNSGYNKKTYVPHAPYTVSPGLFQYINVNNNSGQTISIHNQETIDENLLFAKKEGGFKQFYDGFGMSLAKFKPIGQTSIHYTLAHLSPVFKTIMVHNTMTTKDDVSAALAWNPNIYWATCPNANLYIENRLPDYRVFLDTNAKVTIGTDSLTSNWQLSIWDEILTIMRYQSYIPIETLLSWATLNGAEALGYEDRLGSIEVSKVPGLVNIHNSNIVRLI